MQDSNALLVQQFRENDETAFSTLVRRHYPLVFRVCLKILGHRQDAEDVTQETFSRFAKHVDKNKDKYSTRTERQANLAQTFSKMKKEGADYDALSSFLVQEGADDQAVNYILANWVEDVRLGKS